MTFQGTNSMDGPARNIFRDNGKVSADDFYSSDSHHEQDDNRLLRLNESSGMSGS